MIYGREVQMKLVPKFSIFKFLSWDDVRRVEIFFFIEILYMNIIVVPHHPGKGAKLCRNILHS